MHPINFPHTLLMILFMFLPVAHRRHVAFAQYKLEGPSTKPLAINLRISLNIWRCVLIKKEGGGSTGNNAHHSHLTGSNPFAWCGGMWWWAWRPWFSEKDIARGLLATCWETLIFDAHTLWLELGMRSWCSLQKEKSKKNEACLRERITLESVLFCLSLCVCLWLSMLSLSHALSLSLRLLSLTVVIIPHINQTQGSWHILWVWRRYANLPQIFDHGRDRGKV